MNYLTIDAIVEITRLENHAKNIWQVMNRWMTSLFRAWLDIWKLFSYLPKLIFLLIYFLEEKIKCLAFQRFKLPYFHLITQTIKQSRNKLLGKWFHCCFYWSLINVTWKIACLPLIWIMNNMKQNEFP